MCMSVLPVTHPTGRIQILHYYTYRKYMYISVHEGTCVYISSHKSVHHITVLFDCRVTQIIMADIPNPDKPPDPLAANTSTSTVDVNELLQNPVPMDIATTLGLLDDPSSPFGGSGSLLLPPEMNTGGLVDPSTFQPTTSENQGNLTGGVPETISAAEGPNPQLNIPDVSQLASSLMAAAAASLESSGSSVIEQPTHHEVDSSSPLNPPLIVPDISQFTTANTASSQAVGVTATISQLKDTPSQPADITSQLRDTFAMNSQPTDVTATHTAGSQLEDIPKTLIDPSVQVSTHLSIPNTNQLTTSSPSSLVSSESKGAPPPMSQHVGGVLPHTVNTLSTTGTGQLVPPPSASQGVPVKSPEPLIAPTVAPSSGGLVSTSVQTTSFPSSAPIAPRHPDPPPTSVQANTTSVPLSATTVGNLLASAIASSITNLSSSTTSASSSPSQAASSSPAPALDSASIPKGLNLPLLQFLNLNFPNLRIESIKDILQVNAILATTLQLHEQHKASAALQTPSSSSSSPVAAIPQLPEVKPRPTVSPLVPPTTVKQQPTPPTTSSSLGQAATAAGKTRVFAQVIRPDGTKAAGSPVVIPKPSPSGRNPLQRSSPLILIKQNKATSDLVVHTTLASIPPSTPSSLTTSTRSTRSKFKQDLPSSRALLKNLQLPKELTRTIVQPADSEMMEVDVGQPLLSLNLPTHLKDHSYSLYNPEEGERIVKTRTGGIRITSTIPPARLSYAPQVSS